MTKFLLLFVFFTSAFFGQISLRDPRWQTNGAGALASRPATCTANRHVYICNGAGCTVNGEYHYCTSTNTYTVVGAGGAPSGAAGGDLGGTYPNPSVEKLDGVSIDMTTAAPLNGQSVVFDGTKYIPSTIGTNGIKPGNTKITSSSVLTINDGCSAGDPCNVLVGSTIYTLTTAATATITAGSGSGTAKVFVSAGGVITVQHPTAAGLTITCTNCTQTQIAAPAFPASSVPLYNVTITAGAWTAVQDLRTFVGGGGGGAGAAVYGTYALLPSSCSIGQTYITSDSDYDFICTATDTWTRRNGGFVSPAVPDTGTWTGWVNQGGATIGTTFGQLYITAPASGTNSLRMYVRPTPGTEYTVTAYVEQQLHSENYQSCGLVIRESGDDDQIIFGHGFENGVGGLGYFATSSTVISGPRGDWRSTDNWKRLWLKVVRDATNRTLYIGYDNVNWIQFLQAAVGTDVTEDQLGFFVNSVTATRDARCRLLSWVESTP